MERFPEHHQPADRPLRVNWATPPAILQRGASVQTLDRDQQATLAQLDPSPVRTEPAPHPRGRTIAVAWVLRWSMAVLLLGAAGIHFAAMGEHAGVSWTHGLFFGLTHGLRSCSPRSSCSDRRGVPSR